MLLHITERSHKLCNFTAMNIKTISFILGCISVLMFTCCKTTQYTFEDYPGKVLAVGSAGGFTGAMTKYYIFEDGRLFKHESKGVVTELESIDPKIIKNQFNVYYAQEFDHLELNDPGNMSYFIILNEKDKEKHMIKWGGPSAQASPILEQYYKNLSELIRKHNYTNK